MSNVARLDFRGEPPGVPADPEQYKAAWEYFKTGWDPPGLEVRTLGRGGVFHLRKLLEPGPGIRTVIDNDGAPYVDIESARASAWRWYEARLALVAALEAEGVQLDMWPIALTWSDEQALSCREWIARGPSWAPDDFPDALRRLGPFFRIEEQLTIATKLMEKAGLELVKRYGLSETAQMIIGMKLASIGNRALYENGVRDVVIDVRTVHDPQGRGAIDPARPHLGLHVLLRWCGP